MATFPFSILSPRGKAFEGEAESLSLPGADGGFGVLAGHTPMIAAVKPGVTTVQTERGTEHYFTGEGVMEITRNEKVLLVDEAEKVATEEAGRTLLQQRRERQAKSGTWRH